MVRAKQMETGPESFTPDPTWPSEIVRRADNNNECASNRSWRRPRGKWAGIRNRLRNRPHRTPLLSFLLANVQSIENKLDELRARIKYRRDMRDCNSICLTETWLTHSIQDHAIQPADHLSVHRMDRTKKSRKSRRGGAEHRDAAVIVAGDFDSGANLKRVRPDLRQHVTCPTRGERTLDHCHSPLKDGYKTKSLPPSGKSDHAAAFLIPKYKQRLKQEAPMEREVTDTLD
ncbi:hypothetical protein PFLUV_G00195360 [Perca fluviatilis]|uniref:Uncharacterized protein n=1 Tax=Perca fluviatilis TaxID=8168 RepID=A0A6A5E897_PERFL|nr:hypothetical protein PFLUV_G00195360 [Perca fluviatilis]